MTQGAGEHGRRIPIRQVNEDWSPLDGTQWLALDRILGHRLLKEQKDCINHFCASFAANAPLYTTQNTVLRTKLLPALMRWKVATHELLVLLKADIPPQADFEVFASAASSFKLEGINTVFPFETLIPLLQLSSRSVSFTLDQLDHTQFTTITDLWDVWVTLIDRKLAEAGIKTSARSTANPGKNSVFVEAIKYLQGLLPAACKTKVKDEALVKAIHNARKRHRSLSTESLDFHLTVLAGQWCIPNSIGSVREKSDTELADLESRYQEEMGLVISVLNQFLSNPELAEKIGLDVSKLQID